MLRRSCFSHPISMTAVRYCFDSHHYCYFSGGVGLLFNVGNNGAFWGMPENSNALKALLIKPSARLSLYQDDYLLLKF